MLKAPNAMPRFVNRCVGAARAGCTAIIAAVTAAIALLPALAQPAHADTVHVAVAANFTAPMKRIVADFENTTGHQAVVSYGSTGKLVAQIRNGAPFDVLLAADDATPMQLAKDGLALPASRFTYAVGRLVLWSARADLVDARGEVLHHKNFRHLAIAAPKLAPYGAAAMQTLSRLGLSEQVAPKLVQGESIGQAFNFVASGNADLGFVALSQVWADGKLQSGSAWVVPSALHAPLRQDAVQLVRGKTNPAARALLAHLRTDKVRALIQGYGYTH